ncbi:carbon-nitrogen hydrolase family protein [Lutimaribacter sp. EGI FJ00015]|uniref:Carbon-nitrogen hydrolase family protein n=1 Tax=Lutimaribacter degradans TaxID=2945989 RepID=A0ACC5ZUT6_9RHOB|nr:carbon-nitrogen hydrolase family protein [Lutimaribacter sp. EGI FJ00013]MCM2561309.1 carbon-nitrogen hydrolase family protein [Lutimaribacter sp. EGI FJ00013]MCO0611740.1 carbon-nitrogen hydrolase family protein [Lutimaribacter sp. EGI FJ00015]MCO0635138.1 carbon-nitrogen hydrolase family protein [Lutimaribacter sp. EGI FJ00014]
MKLALYQGPSPAGDTAAAFATIDTTLAAAAASGARMAIMPELFLPGYNQTDAMATLAQPCDGEWQARLAQLCRRHGCGLTIGWAERAGDTIYNTATSLDDTGTVLAHYRKIQLFGQSEAEIFTPGDAYALFDFAGHRCALLICYDIEFAHHVHALADAGATLLLVPTANPAGFDAVPDAMVPARAAETAMTIAYANLCGSENRLRYGGRSVVVGPDARPLASAGRGPALLVVDLEEVGRIDPSTLSTQARDRRLV